VASLSSTLFYILNVNPFNPFLCTVVLRRSFSKKEAINHATVHGRTSTVVRDTNKNEKIRLAKLDAEDGPVNRKRVNPESIQELIRKRIELKLTQEKADAQCALAKHTFREIEAGRLIPSEDMKRRIQQNIGVLLKMI
jgi:DNA-binding XRE family transcriptional regulator